MVLVPLISQTTMGLFQGSGFVTNPNSLEAGYGDELYFIDSFLGNEPLFTFNISDINADVDWEHYSFSINSSGENLQSGIIQDVNPIYDDVSIYALTSDINAAFLRSVPDDGVSIDGYFYRSANDGLFSVSSVEEIGDTLIPLWFPIIGNGSAVTLIYQTGIIGVDTVRGYIIDCEAAIIEQTILSDQAILSRLYVFGVSNYIFSTLNGGILTRFTFTPTALGDPHIYSSDLIEFDNPAINDYFQSNYGFEGVSPDNSYIWYFIGNDDVGNPVQPYFIKLMTDLSGYERINLVAGDSISETLINQHLAGITLLSAAQSASDENFYITGGDITTTGLYYGALGPISPTNEIVTRNPQPIGLPCFSPCVPLIDRRLRKW